MTKKMMAPLFVLPKIFKGLNSVLWIRNILGTNLLIKDLSVLAVILLYSMHRTNYPSRHSEGGE
jgi:hypothetical protein